LGTLPPDTPSVVDPSVDQPDEWDSGAAPREGDWVVIQNLYPDSLHNTQASNNADRDALKPTVFPQ